jgi:hypothetical protein
MLSKNLLATVTYKSCILGQESGLLTSGRKYFLTREERRTFIEKCFPICGLGSLLLMTTSGKEENSTGFGIPVSIGL